MIRPVKRRKTSPASGRAEFLRSSIKAAQKEVEQTLDDEYEAWKRQPPLQEEDALAKQSIKYWLLEKARHPVLSQLALNIYSIPASSADCERVFSELGDLLGRRHLQYLFMAEDRPYSVTVVKNSIRLSNIYTKLSSK